MSWEWSFLFYSNKKIINYISRATFMAKNSFVAEVTFKLNALYTLHSSTNSLKWPLIDYALYFRHCLELMTQSSKGHISKMKRLRIPCTLSCFTLFRLGRPLDLNFGTFMKNFLVTRTKVFLIFFLLFWDFTVGYQKVCRCKILRFLSL